MAGNYTDEQYRQRIYERSIPEPFSGCWLWINSVDKDGYGKFSIKDKCIRAHRASWILHFGPIPEGLCVCHHCDVPCCVNPQHFFLGTNPENTADKIRKGRQPNGEEAWGYGRTHCRGEGSGMAKLTREQIIDIRAQYSTGIPTKVTAAQYGVATSTIVRARNGRSRFCE